MLRFSLWKTTVICLACLSSIIFSIPTIFPSKVSFLPTTKVQLGLDLKGGASLVLEVDFIQYYREKLQNTIDSLRKTLNKSNIYTQYMLLDIDAEKNIYSIRVKFSKKSNIVNAINNEIESSTNTIDQYLINDKELKKVRSIVANALDSTDFELKQNYSDASVWTIVLGSNIIQTTRNNLLGQSLEIVSRRIDDIGTKEIDLQRQGSEKILLQVPGTYDTSDIKRMLGKTAKLTLHHVLEGSYNSRDLLPLGYKLLQIEISKSHKNNLSQEEYDNDEIYIDEHRNEELRFLATSIRPSMSGDMILNAYASIQEGQHVVNLKFTNIGTKIFADITSKNIGKILAIVLDNKIISAPYIREPILSGTCVISGNFTANSANELATLLRAGALPAPLKIVEERTVGPTLGQDSIKAGTNAIIIASISVIIFMILFYGIWGVFANIALIFNVLMIFAIFGIIGATLTLPGLAGIALTLGMAVDANILICERIREEYTKHQSLLHSIESGYKRSFTTIIDSNFTTIAAAIVLYIFGIGPIKGFAISLTIGILCSIFTSIYITKLLVITAYRIFKFQKLGL